MQFRKRLLSAAALLALAPAIHMAPAAAAEGYVTSRYDHQPVRSGFGECVHDYGYREGLRFADCEPAPVQPVAAPVVEVEELVVVIEEPAPAPQLVAQPVPFTVSLDELFDFDSATLRPDGRATLELVASQIVSSGYDSVTIVGHADRIGAAGYNQKLSERRAQAMRDYLVAQGIDSDKISAKGVGSSEPVTAKADCASTRGARLIQCLQPDRYTDVTVAGSVLEVSSMSGNVTQ